MEVHSPQRLSIAFYNGVDNAFLGGANFSVPTNDLCEVARQQNVTDGCYNPNTAVKSPAPSMTLTTVVEGRSSGTVVYTPAMTLASVARRLHF
jgi:hypothetical protein